MYMNNKEKLHLKSFKCFAKEHMIVFRFSHHSVEVRQEHPEDHQVHEDGGRRQVRQS